MLQRMKNLLKEGNGPSFVFTDSMVVNSSVVP